MNVAVKWTEDRVSDNEVVFRSEAGREGVKEVRLRRIPVHGEDPILVWDNWDDAPVFIVERGHAILGGNDA